MPCSRCGKKDPNLLIATCGTEDCEFAGTDIELHRMHLMNQKDKLGECEGCHNRLRSQDAQEKEVIPLLVYSKPLTLFSLFKEKYVSKISCCHGCLGEHELSEDAVNRLARLTTKRQKCFAALNAVLQSPTHEPGDVGEAIPNSERKRAHCIIANQYLEWYFPTIVISFCKLANPRRYRITEPDTYFFRAAMDLVERNWKAAGKKSGLELYDAITSGLVKDLEDNQDFPATLLAITAAMRSSLADRITPSLVDEDDPKILGTPPPEHGGGYPLSTTSMDDKRESFNDSTSIGNLFTALGQCRTPVFMAGNQCEACELSQGEDPLIGRHLRDNKAGDSMAELIRAYRGEGGVFALTVDYLRPCIDYLGRKLWAANKGAEDFSSKRLNRWLTTVLSNENWPVFSLYLTTCLIEASLGHSPFRPGGSMMVKVDANPCPIVHV